MQRNGSALRGRALPSKGRAQLRFAQPRAGVEVCCSESKRRSDPSRTTAKQWQCSSQHRCGIAQHGQAHQREGIASQFSAQRWQSLATKRCAVA